MAVADRFQSLLIEHELLYAENPEVVAHHYALTNEERQYLNSLAEVFPELDSAISSSPISCAVFDTDDFVMSCWLRTQTWAQGMGHWPKIPNPETVPVPMDRVFPKPQLKARDTLRKIHPLAMAIYEPLSTRGVPTYLGLRPGEGRYFSPEARKFYLMLEEATSITIQLDASFAATFTESIPSLVMSAFHYGRPYLEGDLVPPKKLMLPLEKAKEVLRTIAIKNHRVDIAQRLDEIHYWVERHFE